MNFSSSTGSWLSSLVFPHTQGLVPTLLEWIMLPRNATKLNPHCAPRLATPNWELLEGNEQLGSQCVGLTDLSAASATKPCNPDTDQVTSSPAILQVSQGPAQACRMLSYGYSKLRKTCCCIWFSSLTAFVPTVCKGWLQSLLSAHWCPHVVRTVTWSIVGK